jgi:protein-tyrosine-phosphatase/DNA-binding transcriptional ArsR family regulator
VGTPLPRRHLPPPGFLQLAGHPLRWSLLRELARSDRQVHELAVALGQPQNLVSYHLGRLRAGQLVSMRRSSADRRDAYYSADLARCGDLLAGAGAALHPGLRPALPPAVPPPAVPPPAVPPPGVPPPAASSPHGGRADRQAGRAPTRVLFLCTGNSARSQIAEALLGHLADGTVEARSAGSHPKSLHPDAVRVMREHGIDLAGARTKHLSEFAGHRFDHVVTLCDRVREICPQFPGHPDLIHWSIPDPASGSEVASYPAFQRMAEDVRIRVGFLLHLIRHRQRAQEVS